jgi:hypothetical protein
MISSDILNPLILSAFTREITWQEASTGHPLDEFIDTFYKTRARTHETLENLTDQLAAFILPDHSLWSISESVTHLIYTQGFYYNKLVEISTSQLPHAVEAARGFGEGAKQNVPVETLKQSLSKATIQLRVAIEGTRNAYNADKTEANSAFGVCNYQTWMLLMLAHEVDHLRQIVAMRRLARTNT